MRGFIILCLGGALLAGCASAPSHDVMQNTFNEGLKAYDAGDYENAYKKWEQIDDYDLAAMRNVALMLRKGLGVKKDPKAAVEKMEQAAESGLVTAQADLGDMLLKGEAGSPDEKAAFPWLARAADAGHPIAAMELGQLYETGTSYVPKDIETARRLYQIAAEAGIAEAAQRLAGLPPPAVPPEKPAALPATARPAVPRPDQAH